MLKFLKLFGMFLPLQLKRLLEPLHPLIGQSLGVDVQLFTVTLQARHSGGIVILELLKRLLRLLVPKAYRLLHLLLSVLDLCSPLLSLLDQLRLKLSSRSCLPQSLVLIDHLILKVQDHRAIIMDQFLNDSSSRLNDVVVSIRSTTL